MTSELMMTYPSVYAVGNEYQICTLVKKECTMWVEVAGKCYYDHSNGILRSGKFLHIAKLPMAALDAAGEYTVHHREIIERKPYYTDFGEVESFTYKFKTLKEKDEYNIINLADAHSLVEAPIGSGSYFGDDLDLLILNGDIPNHSGDIEYFKAIYQISGGITKGQIPCIFSRGNHDMRGIYGEQMADYSPTDNGKSYFTFRLGPVWGIVLDAGEDKPDEFKEYGWTICCSAFREEEGEFINKVIASKEYEDAPVRLIISHHPFAHRIRPPFDIEQERFADWSAKLKNIKPTLWLSGHLHELFLEAPGGAHDTFGFPCVVVCSSYQNAEPAAHTSGAVTLGKDTVTVKYVNEKGEIVGEDTEALV